MLKKTIVAFLILSFAQTGVANDDSPTIVTFLKRVENNVVRSYLEEILPDGSIRVLYNLNSKSDLEKLFFAEFNAPVEFFFRPTSARHFPEEIAGFRIVKDSANHSCLLEIKRIPNYKKVNDELGVEYPTIGFSGKQLESLTDSMIRQSVEHNTKMWEKIRSESLKRYKIETKSFPISAQLAESLYDKVVGLIGHFDSRYDGHDDDYIITFRCVVGNEVRTLVLYDAPQGDALALSDICREILKEADAQKLDESKYLELLDRTGQK